MEAVDTFVTNINSVQEMILDEERLVTYITVSKELCIHVNLSKRLLYSVVEKIRKDHPKIQLNVSYIISGLSYNKTGKTTVCVENNLDELKEGYKTIFFCHIYSVSKGPPCVDNAAFLLLCKYEDYNLCTGLIKSIDCNKRTSDEIGNLKISSQEAISLERPNKENKTIIKKVKNENTGFDAPKSEPKVEEKKIVETKIKTESISPKKETNISKSTTKTNGHRSQKGIALFFNKANGIQNKKEMKESKETGDEIPVLNISKEEKMDINEISVLEKDIKNQHKEETKEENKSNDGTVIDTKSNKNTSSIKQIKKTAKVDKKRKRVLQISDSDSDEENDPFADKQEISNHESDDEIPPTPSADNNIKITSGIVNPKKRRKIVDKTYAAEDGYVYTKKEEVYESCSEHEEEINSNNITIKPEEKVKPEISPKGKKSSPKKSKKKISPPQKGKQQTLNSFFKRK